MAKLKRGKPCWYELSTTDPDAAGRFYSHVIGWTVADSGMEGFDYRLARMGEAMVAGIMAAQPGMPPAWGFYVTVTDCDKAARAIGKAGGTIVYGPDDIPGTGRFAAALDPQGAAFGILQTLDDDSVAFDQKADGHGNWHELMTSDPVAALDFYGKLFGWKAGQAMDMGPQGTYQLFRHGKADIGGMMRLTPQMPGPGGPFWLPYFGSEGLNDAITRIHGSGGQVLHGPHEVPGGAFIAVARDPQGATFALVGPR